MRPANETADGMAVAQRSLTPLPKRGGSARVVRVKSARNRMEGGILSSPQ